MSFCFTWLRKKGSWVGLACVLLFALVLRVVFLDKVPWGIRNDEAFLFMNGYTIAGLGKDIYGHAFPLIFRPDSGITTAPIPIYLIALCIRFFGLSLVSVKLPTIVSALCGMIVAYLLVSELTGKKWAGVATAFVLAVSPWHVYVSRTGFEAMLANTAVFASWYFLLRSLKKGTGLLPFVVMSLVAAFSYKAVNIVLIAGTVVLLAYAVSVKKGIRPAVMACIISVLFVMLVWWLNVVVYKDTYSIDILKDQTQLVEQKVNLERQDSSAPFPLQQLFTNKLTVRAETMVGYYFDFFSLRTLFLPGENQENAYSMAGFGEIYLFELFFLIVGIISLWRDFRQEALLMFGLLATAPLPAVISSPIYPLRSMIGVYVLAVFIGIGLERTLRYGFRMGNRWGKCIPVLVIFSYAVALSFFGYQYLFRFPVEGYNSWQSYDREAFLLAGRRSAVASRVILAGVAESELLQYSFWNHSSAEDVVRAFMESKDGKMKIGKVEFWHECGYKPADPVASLAPGEVYVGRETCALEYTPDESVVQPKGLKVYWRIFDRPPAEKTNPS